jgi:hypothetical protein
VNAVEAAIASRKSQRPRGMHSASCGKNECLGDSVTSRESFETQRTPSSIFSIVPRSRDTAGHAFRRMARVSTSGRSRRVV